jgi:hypothetical protein
MPHSETEEEKTTMNFFVVEERRFGMGLNWTLIIHFGKRGKFFIFFPFGYKQLIL